MNHVSEHAWRRAAAKALAIVAMVGMIITVTPPAVAFGAQNDADNAAVTIADTVAGKPLIHYSFDNALGGTTIANEGTAADSDGTLNAAAAQSSGQLHLTGDQYITVPTAAIQGKNDLTVSVWLKNNSGNVNTSAAYLGNANTANGYWLLNPANPQGYLKSVMTTATVDQPNNAPWGTEVGPGRSSASQTGVTATADLALYTTVIDGSNKTLTVYRNGQAVADPTAIDENLLSGYGDLVAYIGKSSYADAYAKIDVDDYAVYDSAMTADQVKALFDSEATKDRVGNGLALPSQVMADFTLPATSAGATVTWESSNTEVIAIEGNTAKVTRPAAGEENTSSTLKAVIAYADGTSDTKEFPVTVLAEVKGPIAADAYKPEAEITTKEVTFKDATDGDKEKTITFTHPGLFTNKEYLDAMRDGVRKGEEPWVTAYNSFAGYEFAKKNARIYYSDCFQNVPGPWSSGAALCGLREWSEVTKRLQWDGDTAMRQAMMWYITGDNTYRQHALKIVRLYAGVKTTAGGYDFRSGPGCFGITVAAEILRATDPAPDAYGNIDDSLRWTDDDTTQLSNALDIYSRLFTAEDWRRYMNQDHFCNVGRLAKAIWQDDGEAYADVVVRITRGDDAYGNNGSIYNAMHLMTQNELTGDALSDDQQHAQLMEMGRDAGHAQVDMGGLSTLAQSVYSQGTKVDPETGVISTAKNAVNPFEYENDRLMHGMAYFIKYHLGVDVPWTPMKSNAYQTNMNNFGDGNVTPYLGIVYNYYKYVKKADMTKGDLKIIAYAMETHYPEHTETGASGRNFPGSGNMLFTPASAAAEGSRANTFSGTPELTATSTGPKSVKLMWNGVTGTTQDPQYIVLVTQDAPDADTREWMIRNESDTFVDSYDAKNLRADKQYYWKVRVAGTSIESNEATVAPGDMIADEGIAQQKLGLTVKSGRQLTLFAKDQSGAIADVTTQAQWSSSDRNVAYVNPTSGYVSAWKTGKATVTATYDGKKFTTTVTSVADASLRLHYSFDDDSGATVKDSSGYGNDGKIVTAKTGKVETVEGDGNAKFGKAVTLSGDNVQDASYIAMPGGLINQLDEVTVSAWVKMPKGSNNGFSTSTGTSLFSFTSGDGVNAPANTGQAGQYLELEPARIKLIYRNDAAGTREQSFAIDNPKLTADQWQNITMTIAKDGTTYVYIDGVAVTTPRNADGSNATDESGAATAIDHVQFKGGLKDMPDAVNAWIGKSAWAGNGYLRGSVDDFRIYDKALSADEVNDVILKGDALPVDTSSSPAEPLPSEVDKTKLQAKYDAVKDYEQKKYTVGSWRAFGTARTKAEAVLADADATQAEVDKALTNLANATNRLRLR